jgi:hypothetical protein
MLYRHTQKSPLGWMLLLVTTGCGVGAWLTRDLGMAGVGALPALFAACFWTLTVEDGVDHLAVRFGPVPVFGTRIRYDAMTSVEAGRSTLIDGWGIHFVPGRGWTYNLWGWDCVVIGRGQGAVLRVGTDDAEGLVAFLNARVAQGR